MIGKAVDSYFGAKRLSYPDSVRYYLGLTLVPHSGVAIGLALQLRSIFPKYAEVITAIILGSVLINEVVGPVITGIAIGRAGEMHKEPEIGSFEAI